MSFTHLHLASGFSFKYGTTLPNLLVEQARDLGMHSLALTDRDGLSGAIRFTQSCVENQIAPIIGVDITYENQTRITLLATSGAGWSSLVRVVTALKNYGAPCDLNFLKQNSHYTKNLLALHGPDSEISRALTSRRYDKALHIYNSTRDLFLEQSIECVSHLIYGEAPKSTVHAARMLGFARDHDLPAILTNAARMRVREDAPVADVLDATRNLLPLHQKVVERKNAEAFLKSNDEMVFIAEKIASAAGERNPKQLLRTTKEWAERAVLSPTKDIGLGSIHLPEPQVVGASSHSELVTQLRDRSLAGVNWRYGAMRPDVEERLNKELSIIASLGYESYFLTVADITDRARASGIRVAARGSGAGSLVCHLLGISGVEPLSLGLLMERFCSPLRQALPDIDIDVDSARRLEIYDQVFNSYNQRCATVAMFDKYRARHAIRDVGAALSLPPMEIDLVAKSLPHIRARNISQALENLPELRNLNLTSNTWKMAIGLAERLDGLPRNLAMHPCAVVISNAGLYDRAPIETNASDYPMVQWDKDDVEAIGLLKLDILGVRMQSALAYSVSEIKRTTGLDIDLDWKKYMLQGAKAVHAVNPELLLFVGGYDFAMKFDILRTDVFTEDQGLRTRIVWEWHSYRHHFRYFTSKKLRQSYKQHVRFLADPAQRNRGPVFVGEFGLDISQFHVKKNNQTNSDFFDCLTDIIAADQLDFGVWQLHGRYYVRSGELDSVDTWSVLDNTNLVVRNWEFMHRLQQTLMKSGAGIRYLPGKSEPALVLQRNQQ